MIKRKQTTNYGRALAWVCLVSNISQVPQIVQMGLSSILSILVWLVFVCYLLIARVRWFCGKEGNFLIGFGLCFASFVFLMEVVSEKSYIKSSLVYPILLCIFIVLLVYLVGDGLSKEDMKLIMLYYIIGALLCGIVVFLEYLVGVDLNSRIYAYASKNSVSQILLTAVILLFGNFKEIRTKFFKYACAFSIVFLLYSILLLKSRATIIAIPFLGVFLFFFLEKKYRSIYAVIFIGILLFVFLHKETYDTIINDIILGGRNGSNLDDISSGRLSEWENFFSDFDGTRWLWGGGRTKRESLILTALLEFGLFFGGVIIYLAIKPLLFSFTKASRASGYGKMFFCIAFCYFLNGIFEQLAPFGPGVKCYFLWMMYAILLSKRDANQE